MVNKHTWYILNGYVATSIKGKIILLQEFIMGKPPEGHRWTHKNKDKLDNRVCNIDLRNYIRGGSKFVSNDKIFGALTGHGELPEGVEISHVGPWFGSEKRKD
jgi:hypothetical protein